MALMSIRAYARYRSISHTAVQKAVKQGRITLTDGRIDQAAADQAWAENTHRPKATPEHPQKLLFGAKPPAKLVSTPAALTYSDARRRREEIEARRAEIALQKDLGELVEQRAVYSEFYSLARSMRQSILNIPSRLAGQLASTADEYEVHVLLETELTTALHELSDRIERAKPEEGNQAARLAADEPPASETHSSEEGGLQTPVPTVVQSGGNAHA